MSNHKTLRWALLLITTALLCVLVMRLSYKEDISDFLPLDKADREAFTRYQEVSGADKLVVILEGGGKKAVVLLCQMIEKRDTMGWTRGRIQTEVGMDEMLRMQDFVFDNIPFFLTREDYARMDSLLSQKGFMERQLMADKDKLMYPVPLIADNVKGDPLGLFTPAMMRLGDKLQGDNEQGTNGARSFVFIRSPFGNAETENNARLVEMTDSAVADMQARFPNVKARITGGPQIAVGNARQIKKDSLLAVSIASVLILALLYYYFRSVRRIMLIMFSVCWGWLFALGGMSLIHDRVSLIVLGMGGVILGIAVNYPLHLVAHTLHTGGDMRQTLRETARPLLVGNITTVGAFMALIPLQSAALRDLGIFASLMLAGTMLFVLLFLPHLEKGLSTPPITPPVTPSFTPPITPSITPLLLLIITLFFAWFSMDVEFDSDISHMNYMTEEQRADMQALPQNSLPSATEEREARLAMWNDFVQRHQADFGTRLTEAARKAHFREEVFSRFHGIIRKDYVVQTSIFSDIASTLSDNFNYIGIVCSCVVFLFLWVSFGRFWLAVVSFLPMAVSWIWILGIMALLGMKFNIVNIILATFIFGQGDDYTIFMTEGCRYEYEYGKPMLRSYRSGIMLSAMIMFIGIGTLIVARHPALHSLAEITMVGMACVVLMAWVIPPMCFKMIRK